MGSKNNPLTDWQLMRERFHIKDRFPPRTLRKEKKIDTILSGILNEEPVLEGLPELIESHWNIIAGEQISKHTKPSYLKNGILYIDADHPGWLAEIKRLPKNHLLKKISSVSTDTKITDLRFRLDPSVQTKRSYRPR